MAFQRARAGEIKLSAAGAVLGGSESVAWKFSAKEEDVTTLASVSPEFEANDPESSFDISGFVVVGDTSLAALYTAMRNKTLVAFVYTDPGGGDTGNAVVTDISKDSKAGKIQTYKITLKKSG